MLARLWTTVRTWRATLIALVVLAIVLVVALATRRRDVAAEPPPPPASDTREDIAQTVAPAPGVERFETHRITAVDHGFYCGVVYGVAQVQYDDRVLLIPCMEFLEGRGLRFAAGDEHVLVMGTAPYVAEIKWRGVTYSLADSNVVVAPHDIFGKLTYMFDGKLHYSAPGYTFDVR
jgi:hypothetical protein